jgi:hypothetical protein
MLTEEDASVIEAMAATGAPLGETAKVNRGLITGARGDFFSANRRDDRDVPIIGGADVQRYFTKEPSEYVRFERPASAGGCWLPKVHFAPHKIVVRQIGNSPTASIVLQPRAVTGNIFTVRCEDVDQEKCILGILNSRLMAFFWQTMFADFKSTFPQFTIFSLSRAPIAPWRPDEETCAQFVRLVDSMLAAKQRLAVAKTDHERTALLREADAVDGRLDRLVYDLYGLTDDEIAIVEESVQAPDTGPRASSR